MKNKVHSRRAYCLYKLKMLVARISLLALAVAFELAARLSKTVQKEISFWATDLVFSLGVLPDGPSISMKKIGNRVRYLGTGLRNPDVAIMFKNVDCALMVFTGQIGTPVAAAQRRFIVHGNISESSRVARVLAIVQAFLFPGIIVNNTYRRPPKMGLRGVAIKTAIYLALVPGLIVRAFR